jgi:hypothetical protein
MGVASANGELPLGLRQPAPNRPNKNIIINTIIIINKVVVRCVKYISLFLSLLYIHFGTRLDAGAGT